MKQAVIDRKDREREGITLIELLRKRDALFTRLGRPNGLDRKE